MPKIIDTSTMDLDELSEDETHWVYNGFDCCVTEEIFRNLHSTVDSTALATYEFSKSLQAPILEMACRGILINQNCRRNVIADMEKKLSLLTDQFNTIVRDGVGVSPINWNSPVQLKNLLYDVMGLPVQKKRGTNGLWAPSTGRDQLEALSMYFIAQPIVYHIMGMRELGKSLGFLRTANDGDGRMRSSFNIGGTVSGRLSSEATDFDTGTNLQNITSSLRSVFVADPGYKLANLDLEQGDSRNVGALCWNLLVDHSDWSERSAGAYLDACESGDLHTLVTKMGNPNLPWGEEPDRKIADRIAYRHLTYRDLAKKLGHGSNYLAQPQTAAKHAKIPLAFAKNFQANYFEAFPCIPAWHKSVLSNLKSQGFLISPFGRRRYFFGRPEDGATQREAVAHVPQSMTSDIINQGLLRLWRANRIQLLNQVHDSVLFQYPEEEENEIIPWALETLRIHLELKQGRDFFIPTEAQVGWNWGYYDETDNVDGLVKWKGADNRVRQESQFQLSLLAS